MSRYRTKTVNGASRLEHRWVWEQVHGSIPDGMQVHHKDHDPHNNDIDNLELVTTKDHGLLHSTYPRSKTCEVCGGEYEPAPTKRKRAKTCSPECRAALIGQKQRDHAGNQERDAEIRRLFAAGETNADLASRFDLSPPSITRITRHGR